MPCFAFEVPTYDEDTAQLIYYISGLDDLFYVKDDNSYFLYNPTDSVLTVRLTLTNYFTYRSRFYIITSYSWVDNNSCSITYSSKFSTPTIYTFTDYFGGDVSSEFVSFVGTINPDGSDNVDFESREYFCEISINPGKVCAFQFAYNRIPPVNDEGPGYDSTALMDDTGLMAYTSVLYHIAQNAFIDIDGNYIGQDFDFFNLFNQIGQFTKLQGYNTGYVEALTDGKNLGYSQGFEAGKEFGLNQGFLEGYNSAYSKGYIEGVAKTLVEIGADSFEGVDTFEEAYNLGVKHAEDLMQANESLMNFLPTLFESVFDGVFVFTENLSNSMTIFGLDVSEVIFTFLGVALAVSLFSFVVGKIG